MTSLNAQEIQEQLVSLREDARSRSPGEISRVENVAEEFFQLAVPRDSEILDVAAGSGIVSALLQTGGNARPSQAQPGLTAASHDGRLGPQVTSTSMLWTATFRP